jgi:hypothetical protein
MRMGDTVCLFYFLKLEPLKSFSVISLNSNGKEIIVVEGKASTWCFTLLVGFYRLQSCFYRPGRIRLCVVVVYFDMLSLVQTFENW